MLMFVDLCGAFALQTGQHTKLINHPAHANVEGKIYVHCSYIRDRPFKCVCLSVLNIVVRGNVGVLGRRPKHLHRNGSTRSQSTSQHCRYTQK